MEKFLKVDVEVVSHHIYNAFDKAIDKICEEQDAIKTYAVKAGEFNIFALGQQIADFENISENVTKLITEKAEKIASKYNPQVDTLDYIPLGKKGYFRLEAKIKKVTRHHTGVFFVHEIEKGIEEVYRPVGLIWKSFNKKSDAEVYALALQVKHPELRFGVYVSNNVLVSHTMFQEKYYNTKPQVSSKEGRLILPAYHYRMIGTKRIEV